jgi:hypothetical protein
MASNALADFKRSPRNSLMDATRGALLGATTDSVGYIPDAVADFMRPFGYNVPRDQVVGGTEWLANRVSQPTNSLAETGARFATGMMTPSPMDFARLGKAPMQEIIEGPLYRGSHIPEEGVRPNTYVTPDQEYSQGFGDYARKFNLDTEKTLDLRDIGNEEITLNQFLDTLKSHGLDDDTLHDIYYRSNAAGAAWENILKQRPWQWVRQHTEAIAAGAKESGMDSIRMVESQFSGKNPGKVAESWVVLDPSRLSQINE